MKTPITIIFIIVFSIGIKAQHYTHEIGAFIGTTSLQSDYGEKGNFASDWNNNGISFSIAHYLSFYNRTLRWDPNDVFHNHLMVKTTLNYVSYSKIKHYSKWAESQSYSGEQLRAMEGSLSMFNIGVNLEYFLTPLEEFIAPYSDISFNPYLAVGFKYSFYKNSLNSTLGDWRQDITVLPEKYTTPNALAIGKGNALSLDLGLGTRYKLTEKLDLAVEFGFQYFLSDKIDGLQADVTENKNNEWLMNLQFGIVYHLNFYRPLFL
ncbi:hypothetical protein MC378_06380 [Polaribacter sp. MSW13]|uniref:Glutamate dehydrogenase n=1 Tax=Polaribacter marinus TaxID=2916838 RepID=A0A9X1VNE3_9FLAO|nr:hypothetical protein [Polaribacter marinus]MCI2228788.1 hypothetical protein [Polaribacter marinus]